MKIFRFSNNSGIDVSYKTDLLDNTQIGNFTVLEITGLDTVEIELGIDFKRLVYNTLGFIDFAIENSLFLETISQKEVVSLYEPISSVFEILNITQACIEQQPGFTQLGFTVNITENQIAEVLKLQYSINEVLWFTDPAEFDNFTLGENLINHSVSTSPIDVTVYVRLCDEAQTIYTPSYEFVLESCGAPSVETLVINSITGQSCDTNTGILTASISCNIQNPVGLIELQFLNNLSEWSSFAPQVYVIHGANSINLTFLQGQNNKQFRLKDLTTQIVSNVLTTNINGCVVGGT